MRSATRRFAELANEMDVAVAFDVNLRENLWDSLDAFRAAVEPMLDLSTIVKLSEEELGPVLGTDDEGEAADLLLDRGVSLVLVSRGGDGAFYATRAFRGDAAVVPDRRGRGRHGRGGRVPRRHLAHLSENPDWLDDEAAVGEAVRRGTAGGALACTQFGAMQGLPTREELEQLHGRSQLGPLRWRTRDRRARPVPGAG